MDELFTSSQTRRTAAVKPAAGTDRAAAFWSNMTARGTTAGSSKDGKSKAGKSPALLRAAKQLTPAVSDPSLELWRGCQLRLVLVYELISEERAVALYPINSLRNLARLLTDTPLIANLDVDMLPSLSLCESLAPGAAGTQGTGTGVALLEGVEAQQRVYIVPAFETRCGGPLFADAIVVSDKASLGRMDGGGCLGRFRARVAPWSHLPTNFDVWHHGDGSPYHVAYTLEFEPWFLSSRQKSLFYDSRFRGYGKNKVVQVAAMNASGVSFWVHGSGFLVHRTHTESKPRRQFLRTKYSKTSLEEEAGGSMFGHVEAMWNVSQVDMRRTGYLPRVEDVLTRCLADLPWWQ